MKNKTLSIFKYEFRHTVTRKGFIIMTFIIPVLVLIGIGIGRIKSSATDKTVKETQELGCVDEAGIINHFTDQTPVVFRNAGNYEDALGDMVSGEISGLIVVPDNYLSTGNVMRYTLNKELGTSPEVSESIRILITSNLLAGKVDPEIISRITGPLQITTVRISESGTESSERSGWGNIIVPGVFALLLGLSLQTISGYMLQGFGDEKESRIIEVLLSSVSAKQLIIGKIAGLGTAGLLQVLVWLISAPLLLKFTSSSVNAFVQTIVLPPHFIFLGVVFFVLGYLFFAVLSVGVGAISPNAREGQQLSLLYTMFVYVPLWLVSLLLMYPASPFWIILSLIPVTAPVQMLLLMGIVEVPVWQVLTSIAVMVVSIIFFLNLSIRIFRTHFLMHGRLPKLKEMLVNMRMEGK